MAGPRRLFTGLPCYAPRAPAAGEATANIHRSFNASSVYLGFSGCQPRVAHRFPGPRDLRPFATQPLTLAWEPARHGPCQSDTTPCPEGLPIVSRETAKRDEIVDNSQVNLARGNGRRLASLKTEVVGLIPLRKNVTPWAAATVLACLFVGSTQAADVTAAKVINAGGNVSLIRHDSLWALFPNQTVAVGETIVTGDDGFAHLEVSDGSSFVVYPNSHVVFRKNPGSLGDLVDIFLGRIKIYIQGLGGGPSRHRIFTPTAVISVRGTTFDVSVDENETTVVSVEEGVVGVRHRLLPSNKEIPVAQGQSLTIYREAPLAKAGVNKVKVVRAAGDVARTLGYIWARSRRTAGGSAPSAGGGGLPGDTSAPSPPLPGDTPAPQPPPPPPE